VACDIETAAESAAIEAEGFTFHRLRVQRGRANAFFDAQLLVRLTGLYRELRPNIVHHVTVKPVVYGGLAARMSGIGRVVAAVSGLGYVFTAGAGSRRWLRSLVTTLYRIALGGQGVRVIFQNAADRQVFIDRKIVNESACVLIAGSGVDLAAFHPEPEPPGMPIVLLPARLLRDKGVIEFAEAAKRLTDAGVVARFQIAGRLDEDNPAGMSRAEIDSLCQRTGVEWLGQRDDMAGLYRASHVICLPSYREGLSKTLIEAAASGRPMVASDVPGCREVVLDDVTGLTVPPRDPWALAKALQRLLMDPALRQRFGQAARRLAESAFDERLIVEQTLGVYHELLAGAVAPQVDGLADTRRSRS
jgi:glycosyltransferase involved in cell wall biosynthesis